MPIADTPEPIRYARATDGRVLHAVATVDGRVASALCGFVPGGWGWDRPLPTRAGQALCARCRSRLARRHAALTGPAR